MDCEIAEQRGGSMGTRSFLLSYLRWCKLVIDNGKEKGTPIQSTEYLGDKRMTRKEPKHPMSKRHIVCLLSRSEHCVLSFETHYVRCQTDLEDCTVNVV